MATAKKHIYGVFYGTSAGIGMCPVKADNKAEARTKFRKHNKRAKNIASIDKLDPESSLYPRWKQAAI